MKSSDRTSSKNDGYLAKHFYKKTKTNTANSYDWSILMVLIWSIGLTSLGLFTKKENRRLEQHSQLEFIQNVDNNFQLWNPEHCTLSESALSLKVNSNWKQELKLEEVVLETSVALNVNREIQSSNTSHLITSKPNQTSTSYFQHHTTYQAPKLQFSHPVTVPKPQLVIEKVRLPRNYASDTTLDPSKKSKLRYAVNEVVAPLQKEANASGKLVVLSFGAKWCLPCKQMEKHTFPDREVQQLLKEKYVWKKINVQDITGYSLQQYYDVEILPTTLIINGNGEVIGRFQQGLTAQQMRSILNEFQGAQYRTLPKLTFKDPQEVQQIEIEAQQILTSVKAGFALKNSMNY